MMSRPLLAQRLTFLLGFVLLNILLSHCRPAAEPVPVVCSKAPTALFRGTNLSGAEFAPQFLPGEPGVNYQYPDPSSLDYFAAQGMNHLRLPFLHERLQPVLKGPLDEAEWKRLAYVVTYANQKGMTVALDAHNSFRHRGNIVTELEIADLWGKVAARVKDSARAQINITNEPHDMTTEAVVMLSNAAIKAIRAAGFQGLVLVDGNAYSGAWRWSARDYGTPNDSVMQNVGLGDANVVFDAHQYFDAKGNGTGECVAGAERLTEFTGWLRAVHRKALLGEFAGINTAACKKSVTDAIAYIEANGDAWIGWNWWGAGEWSFSSTYPLSIGPADPPKPQLAWLLPFLACNPKL